MAILTRFGITSLDLHPKGFPERRLMVMGSPALNIGITDPWAEYPDRIQNRRQALTSYGVLCLSIIAHSLC